LQLFHHPDPVIEKTFKHIINKKFRNTKMMLRELIVRDGKGGVMAKLI
jgi:hypothetical protein